MTVPPMGILLQVAHHLVLTQVATLLLVGGHRLMARAVMAVIMTGGVQPPMTATTQVHLLLVALLHQSHVIHLTVLPPGVGEIVTGAPLLREGVTHTALDLQAVVQGLVVAGFPVQPPPVLPWAAVLAMEVPLLQRTLDGTVQQVEAVLSSPASGMGLRASQVTVRARKVAILTMALVVPGPLVGEEEEDRGTSPVQVPSLLGSATPTALDPATPLRQAMEELGGMGAGGVPLMQAMEDTGAGGVLEEEEEAVMGLLVVGTGLDHQPLAADIGAPLHQLAQELDRKITPRSPAAIVARHQRLEVSGGREGAVRMEAMEGEGLTYQ